MSPLQGFGLEIILNFYNNVSPSGFCNLMLDTFITVALVYNSRETASISPTITANYHGKRQAFPLHYLETITGNGKHFPYITYKLSRETASISPTLLGNLYTG